jgi:hypothetical protein
MNKRQRNLFILALLLFAASFWVEPALATQLIEPELSIDFPDINFTSSAEDGSITVNFLGEYIAGVYRWLIGASTTIAIVFIMIGGIMYAFGAASQGAISKAKERIKNAVIGLVLLLSVHLMMITVNPNLVIFKPLTIETVKKVELESLITEALKGCTDVKGTVDSCTVQTLTTPSGWDSTLTDIVNEVGAAEGVDPILIATHLQKETGGALNYPASQRGPCGEIGATQFMPVTFEAVVGKECCVSISAKSSATADAYGPKCDNEPFDWPPTEGGIVDCNTDICGNCQLAASSCAEYMEDPRNAVTAAARLIKYNLSNSRVGGDLALAMCAYNGSGSQAAAYTQSAAQIYSTFCQNSGGTN